MFDLNKALVELENPHLSEEQKHAERVKDTDRLVHDLIGRHAEFFADPTNRLDFIKGQTVKDFFMMSQYVNAKLRGEKPYELKRRPGERRGSSLPLLHTPSSVDKLWAFGKGFRAIQEYLGTTTDSTEKQVEGVAMATEALIIWVHPFVDGNGRTSRFMAKLIEDGAVDTDALIEAMYLNIKHLLENDEIRTESAKYRPDFTKAA